MLQGNIIYARRVVQNNQEFFLGVFSIRQILSFTKFTERLIITYDEENKPVYNNEIQRKVENSRVEKIADFLIDDPEALFPTNLVLSIPTAVINSIEEKGNDSIEIELSSKVFSEIRKTDGDVYLTIIDGQHRIRGIERAIERLEKEISSIQATIRSAKESSSLMRNLEKCSKLLSNLLKINLSVSFFLDPTLEFQAMIFSTINRTQKSVPQSLVYSLFGLTEKDSPQKTSLQIILALNSLESSPFYNRIKLHGGKYERNQSPPLTQASMVKSIIDLISVNIRESERDRFRPRKDLLKNVSPDFPFRKYYANNQDNFISDIMYSFFTAVRTTFVDNETHFWDFEENTKPTNILQTTVGYSALLEILVDILRIESEDDRRDKIATYVTYLSKAKSIDFKNTDRYPFTSKSKSILYLDLSLSITPAINSQDARLLRLEELMKNI